MDTKRLEELLALQQEATGRAKTFADSLKDRRAQAEQVIQAGTPRFSSNTTAGGIPTNPITNIDLFQTFANAARGIVTPQAEAESMYQKQVGTEADLLAKIYELSNKGEATTVEDLLKQRKAAQEAGFDTKAYDDALAGKGLTKASEKQLTEKEQKALNALNNLKKLYGKGSAENVGTGKDLSERWSRGIVGNLQSFVNEIITSVGLKPKTAEDVKNFKNALNAAAPLFSQALGSGTPQEGEFKRMLDSAPGLGSTDKEAQTWFKQMESMLSGMEMNIETEKDKNSELDEVDEQLIKKYGGK